MICEKTARRCCKDDLSKIENYDKAVADQTQTWDCHHRLELTLDGEFAHSAEELQKMGMYLHRPYFELIFLPHDVHMKLHTTNLSEDTKAKRRASMKGKPKTAEHRAKLSAAKKGKTPWNKGKKSSDATRRKISLSHKGMLGKKHSDETLRKMAESRRKYWERKRAKESSV